MKNSASKTTVRLAITGENLALCCRKFANGNRRMESRMEKTNGIMTLLPYMINTQSKKIINSLLVNWI
jgi:hypothetical protein